MRDYIEYQRVEIEKFKWGLRKALDSRLMDVCVDVYFDTVINRVVFEVEGFLWGQRVANKKVEYPTDWWQAFKERWFPVWLKRRFPVKYVVHWLDYRLAYPDYRLAFPGHKTTAFTLQETDCVWRYGGDPS